MKRSVAIPFVVLALVLTGIVVLQSNGPAEPIYNGRRLRDWLKDYGSGSGPRHDAAYLALKAIGSNAIPYLLFEFESGDPKWVTRLKRSAFTRGVLKRQLQSEDPIRYTKAVHGLLLLGPQLAPVLPRLAKYLDDPTRCEYATLLVASAGEAGLRYFLTVLNSSDPTRVKSALRGIARMRAAAAIPVVLPLLNHPAPAVRVCAVRCLSQIRSNDPLATSALQRALVDPAREVRWEAAMALRYYSGSVPLRAESERDSTRNKAWYPPLLPVAEVLADKSPTNDSEIVVGPAWPSLFPVNAHYDLWSLNCPTRLLQ